MIDLVKLLEYKDYQGEEYMNASWMAKEEIKTRRGDREGWFWKIRVHHRVNQLIDFDIPFVTLKKKNQP